MNFRIRNASDFHNRRERDSEKTPPDAEQQSLNAREGERRTKLNCCAASFLRRNVNGSLDAVKDGSDDIHADAPARYFRYFGSGTESRFEDEVESFQIRQAHRLVGF